ncbi:MAG: hypothetical protein HQ591_08265 [candidate division Zixibacteria bacterium]|nr:hypothetical protein [Candidatus Tariuqbacter arcticus]
MKYLTFIFLLVAAVLISAPFNPLFSGDNLLESFNGGMQDMTLFGNSALTTGIGGYEAAAGIGITTLRPTPAAVYWNPAGLAFLKRGGIIVEAVPKLSYSPDMSESINEEVDAALEDFDRLEGLDPSQQTSVIYPDFTLTAGQGGQAVASLAMAIPYRDFFLGLSYYRAFSLGLNLISAGVETKISTQEEDPYDNATIFTSTDINLLLNFEADVVSFGAGRMLNDKLGAGLTLSHISANTTMNGLLAPEGVFTRRSTEKSFNDPSAVWQNDFYSSMVGDFNGGSWGVKAGLAYQLNERICFNMLINYNGDMTLEGEMDIVQYFYPALNLNADEDAGEEAFDLDNIENFAQPTETVLADNEASDELQINVPSSISLGAAYRGISFTLSSYSGELSYAYDLARDGIMATYSRGLKLKYGFLFGFDLKYIRLGLGAIAADEVVSGYKEEQELPNGEKQIVPVEPTTGIYLPRFSLGTGFNINRDWKCDILLMGVPDLLGSVLKVSATYTL